jgi:hypothetical protein
MKKIYILLITIAFFMACSNNDEEISIEEEQEESISILGTWLRIAGRKNNDSPPIPPDELQFIEAVSENTVTFYPDSTVVSNSVSLCSNTPFMGDPTMGIYSLIDSTYTSIDCTNPDRKYDFTQSDSILIISYPYLGISEGKFKKIEDMD